jgi:hypothetical protein
LNYSEQKDTILPVELEEPEENIKRLPRYQYQQLLKQYSLLNSRILNLQNSIEKLENNQQKDFHTTIELLKKQLETNQTILNDLA